MLILISFFYHLRVTYIVHRKTKKKVEYEQILLCLFDMGAQ